MESIIYFVSGRFLAFCGSVVLVFYVLFTHYVAFDKFCYFEAVQCDGNC